MYTYLMAFQPNESGIGCAWIFILSSSIKFEFLEKPKGSQPMLIIEFYYKKSVRL